MRYTHLTLLAILFTRSLAIGQWTEIAPTITPVFHNSGVAYNGKVYFTGGPKTQAVTIASYNNKVEVLDLETGEISIAPAHTSPARCAIGGVAFNGKIYFAGGHKWIGAAPGLQLYDQLDIFDVATQTWEYKHLPVAKTWFATAVVKGKILFAGGYIKVGNQIVPTDVVNVFDPSNGEWSVMHLSQARAELSAAVIGNKVWFCCGQTSWTTWAASSRVDSYDADLNEWKDTVLSVARAYPAVATAGQYVICAGGYTNTVGYSNQIDMFDTSSGSWSTAILSAPRFAIAAATLGNKAYFTGGGHLNLSASYYDQSSNIVDVFDATTGLWSPSTLTKNRVAHTCTAWENKIIVGGGWRAEQTQTTGSIEILTDLSTAIPSIPRAETVDLEIFPNPTSNQLTIKFENLPASGDYATISILDAYGKVIRQPGQIITAPQTTLETGDLEQGLYFLSITFASGKTTVRPFSLIK